MCNTLQVRWTIVPKIAPQPWIMCGGCGGLRAFQSSDKIRLNANSRKLDAWLIYKCTTCDKTWNRSIFERKNVRDIEPSVLEALQSNDPHWVRAETFNLEALKKKSQRIDEFASFEIRKELLRADPGWIRLEIELSVPFSASMRLDRLLASELQISRSQLGRLYESGLLQANSDRTDMLRRRIKDGLRLTIDQSNLDDRDLFWKPPAIDEIADR